MTCTQWSVNIEHWTQRKTESDTRVNSFFTDSIHSFIQRAWAPSSDINLLFHFVRGYSRSNALSLKIHIIVEHLSEWDDVSHLFFCFVYPKDIYYEEFYGLIFVYENIS